MRNSGFNSAYHLTDINAVSYTHLDVNKRQYQSRTRNKGRKWNSFDLQKIMVGSSAKDDRGLIAESGTWTIKPLVEEMCIRDRFSTVNIVNWVGYTEGWLNTPRLTLPKALSIEYLDPFLLTKMTTPKSRINSSHPSTTRQVVMFTRSNFVLAGWL